MKQASADNIEVLRQFRATKDKRRERREWRHKQSSKRRIYVKHDRREDHHA